MNVPAMIITMYIAINAPLNTGWLPLSSDRVPLPVTVVNMLMALPHMCMCWDSYVRTYHRTNSMDLK